MIALLLLLAAPVHAQDGPPAGWTEVPVGPVEADTDAPATGADDPGEEVVVWGTAAVRQARAAVVQRFEELGWRRHKTTSDGALLFKGPEPWMGAAKLTPDGLVQFRRRWVWVDPVREVAGPPADGMEALDPAGRRGSAGTRSEGGLHGPAGQAKVQAAHDALLRGVDAKMDRYRAVLAETALQQRLQVLPARLDRLWTAGESLSGGPALPTPEARRAAVLDYWASRADTRSGRLAAEVVEDWIAETVQISDHPFTAAELDAAAARKGPGWHPLPDRP